MVIMLTDMFVEEGCRMCEDSSNVLLSCCCDWLLLSDPVIWCRIYMTELCPIKDCYHAATHILHKDAYMHHIERHVITT